LTGWIVFRLEGNSDI